MNNNLATLVANQTIKGAIQLNGKKISIARIKNSFYTDHVAIYFSIHQKLMLLLLVGSSVKVNPDRARQKHSKHHVSNLAHTAAGPLSKHKKNWKLKNKEIYITWHAHIHTLKFQERVVLRPHLNSQVCKQESANQERKCKNKKPFDWLQARQQVILFAYEKDPCPINRSKWLPACLVYVWRQYNFLYTQQKASLHRFLYNSIMQRWIFNYFDQRAGADSKAQMTFHPNFLNFSVNKQVIKKI